MRFDPKTQEQLDADNLKPGVAYDFEVIKATDGTSKAGNEMISLEMSVFTPSGKRRTIRDWLVSAMEHKLRHFAFATGLGPAYEAGGFEAQECFGRTGKVILKKERDGDRLEVKDYVESETMTQTPARQPDPARAPQAAIGGGQGGPALGDEPPFARYEG